MDSWRDRRGRSRTPFWVSLTFCFIASLERTAHSFSPSQRLHPRSSSYPPIQNNHPRSLSSRLFRSSSNLGGLPGDGLNSKNPPQESSESFTNQHTNTTLLMVVEEEKEDENRNVKPRTTARAPSTRTILEFAIPAIGIWLCGPLMSIIDTSAVGLISGTAQQAALNPAIAVTDYSASCMSFLYTGTTNLVATAQETDRDSVDQAETKKTLVGALRLSLRVGLGFCIVVLLLSNSMLHRLVGHNAINPDVLAAAQKYVWIRSLSMPAAAMIGSAQAACLGMHDVKSPLYITLMAAVVNALADLWFVPHSHPWLGGAAGAAWGTTLSQYAAAAIYIYWLSHSPKDSRLTRAWAKIRGKKFPRLRRRGSKNAVDEPKTATEPDESSTESDIPVDIAPKHLATHGFLQDSFKVMDLIKKRNKEDKTSRGYIPFVVPVTTTQVGRCSVYVAMGHVVSSSLGTVNMAANQILTSFFYALIPIADALSQTAQALLPRIFASTDLSENPKEKTRVVGAALKSFTKAALLCGATLGAVVACIPLVTKLLMTSDPAVLKIVNSVVPIHFIIFCLHGIFCASEGILMAQKDLGFLGRMYALYFFVVPALMLRLKRQGAQLQLQSIWLVFLGYQLFRLSAWVGRVGWLFWKTQQEGETSDDTLAAATVAQ